MADLATFDQLRDQAIAALRDLGGELKSEEGTALKDLAALMDVDRGRLCSAVNPLFRDGTIIREGSLRRINRMVLVEDPTKRVPVEPLQPAGPAKPRGEQAPRSSARRRAVLDAITRNGGCIKGSGKFDGHSAVAVLAEELGEPYDPKGGSLVTVVNGMVKAGMLERVGPRTRTDELWLPGEQKKRERAERAAQRAAEREAAEAAAAAQVIPLPTAPTDADVSPRDEQWGSPSDGFADLSLSLLDLVDSVAQRLAAMEGVKDDPAVLRRLGQFTDDNQRLRGQVTRLADEKRELESRLAEMTTRHRAEKDALYTRIQRADANVQRMAAERSRSQVVDAEARERDARDLRHMVESKPQSTKGDN